MSFEYLHEEKWSKLDFYVRTAGFKHHNQRFLEEIGNRPLTTKSIDQLVQLGWKVYLTSSSGYCSYLCKEIEIDRNSKNYIRDNTLFHELVHAWYDAKEFSDSPQTEFDYGFDVAQNNRIITEWSARQLRANPDLLRHAVHSFGLKPYKYDLVSYQAFCFSFDNQLAFSFEEEYFKSLEAMMD